MWCEWLVLIFPDWCLGSQRVTVCVWVLQQENLITRKHIYHLSHINALMFIMCKCRKLFFVFCRSHCKQIQNYIWLVFLILYLSVQSTRDPCSQTVGKLLSRHEFLQSCWKVILKCVYNLQEFRSHCCVCRKREKSWGAPLPSHLFLSLKSLWSSVSLVCVCGCALLVIALSSKCNVFLT